MKHFGNFQPKVDNRIIKLPIINNNKNSKLNQNKKLNQSESLKLSYDELNLNNNKDNLISEPVDSFNDIISHLLNNKPIYNRIYPHINLSKDSKRHDFKLSSGEIINNYQNCGNLYRKRNCPAREIKVNSLITEINKSVSLKKSDIYKESKLDFMKNEYDLLNNKNNQKIRKERSIKINPKIANLLVYSPGEWKKNRNCSLKYHFNKNRKSIDEVTDLLHDIGGKVKETFVEFKQKAEKEFDDIDNNFN